MQYTVEVTINLPRERVMALLDDRDNFHKWQDGLRSFEHISGQPGQVGAKSRMIFDISGRQVELTETITRSNPPDDFASTYEATGVLNTVENRFYEAGSGKTRWVADHKFNFSGPMKIFSLAMGSAFPRRTRETMESFKAFAENAGP